MREIRGSSRAKENSLGPPEQEPQSERRPGRDHGSRTHSGWLVRARTRSNLRTLDCLVTLWGYPDPIRQTAVTDSGDDKATLLLANQLDAKAAASSLRGPLPSPPTYSTWTRCPWMCR